MRGHNPVLIEEFNGLWKRGDAESVPLDHFSECNNIQFQYSGFRTRDGINIYPIGAVSEILRIYTYITHGVESILILDNSGQLWHSTFPTTPILTISGMTDFAFYGFAGRAYISPHNGVLGLQNEFVYVYKGDGTPARKAGGSPPVGAGFTAANSATTGDVEAGIHVFGIVFETDTGFLTQIGPDTLPTVNATGGKKVSLSGITISPDSFVVARHIVATKAIDPTLYTGDTKGYQLFFVPNGKISDNTTTTLDVSFFDADLLEDASHLLDLFTNIPAGVNLNLYHNRLIVVGQFGDPTIAAEVGNSSLAHVSYPGEPEAFDQVSGILQTPIEGTPLTNGQEYRDILYLFKATRTYAFSDNGDDPTSWPLTIIDQGVGASVHGVATVLDSGGVNIEYLIIIDYSGVMLFNGIYQRPELSWKIRDFWLALDRAFFSDIQIMNDSLSQYFYITLPNQQMLFGDYSENLDPMKIKWCPWTFDIATTTITLINTNTLLIGSLSLVVP